MSGTYFALNQKYNNLKSQAISDGGGINKQYINSSGPLITGAISLTGVTYQYYPIYSVSGAFTITIETPSSSVVGKMYIFRRVSGDNSTVTITAGTANIYTGVPATGGNFTLSVAVYGVQLICLPNGSNTNYGWYVV